MRGGVVDTSFYSQDTISGELVVSQGRVQKSTDSLPFMGQSASDSASALALPVQKDSVKEIPSIVYPKRKKIPKAYRYQDSYLITQKDSFKCLSSLKQNDSSVAQFSYFIPSGTHKNGAFNKKKFITETAKEVPDINTTKFPLDSLSSSVWLMLFLFSNIALFTVIRYFFKQNIKKYFQALFSEHFFKQIFENQNINNIRLSYFLGVFASINISLIIYYTYLYIHHYTIEDKGFSFFLKIWLYYFIAVLIYKVTNAILGYIFDSKNLMKRINFNWSYFLIIIGTVLFPVSVVLPYLAYNLQVVFLCWAWGIIVLMVLLRWYKTLQISFRFYVPYLYWIIYLCALEIIPIIFIFKWSLK